MDESELAGLSEEERAALAPEDGDVQTLQDVKDEIDSAVSAGAEDDALEEEDDSAESGEADPAAGKDAAPAKKDDAGDDAAGKADTVASDGDADEEEDTPFVPRYTADQVDDFDAKIKVLNDRQAAAVEKFKDGDLGVDDYNAERDAIEAERTTLEKAQIKAEIAEEQRVQTAQQAWEWEINRFYRRVAKSDGIDYKASKLLTAALDQQVRDLADDEKNADKDGVWFLSEAHRIVKDQLGLARVAPGAAERNADPGRKAADKVAAAIAARKPNRAGIPTTLADLPNAGSGSEDTGGDEFSKLDRLEGIELEMALARLPKETADRYLHG